ncbi:MAG: hypothetical protein ACRD1L_13465, partial [Terriglobales bacterium]
MTAATGRVVVAYRETAPEETEYYHYDGLGSMVLQMNQAGQQEAQLRYYPWGQVWLTSPGNPDHGDFADMQEGGASG